MKGLENIAVFVDYIQVHKEESVIGFFLNRS